jgi:uncharacterized iron-regulated membrane protein
MKRAWIGVHRYLSLVAAIFWLIQALTGVAIAFRWELDDALVAGGTVATQPARLGARVEAIERDRGSVSSLWASSSAASRFDIYYTDASGADRVMRVDGAGRILRDGRDGALVVNGGIFNSLTRVHQSLFAGSIGEWIVALSGILLLTNLVLGLRLAWPSAGAWRRALFQPLSGRGSARVHGFHRMTGLWGAIPALVLVLAGVLLAFSDGLRDLVSAEVPAPTTRAERSDRVPLAGLAPGAALEVALARYPGSALSALTMPVDGQPWFQIRLRAPNEVPRNWGTTTLFVDAATGEVLGDHDARQAPAGRAFVDSLYPIHSGQWAGISGRTVVLILGMWLATMVVLGLTLWFARRSKA